MDRETLEAIKKLANYSGKLDIYIGLNEEWKKTHSEQLNKMSEKYTYLAVKIAGGSSFGFGIVWVVLKALGVS